MITRGYSPVENNSHGAKRLGSGGVAVPAAAPPHKPPQTFPDYNGIMSSGADWRNDPPAPAESQEETSAAKPCRPPEVVPVMAAAAAKPAPAGEVALFVILNIIAAAAVWFLWTQTAVRAPLP